MRKDKLIFICIGILVLSYFVFQSSDSEPGAVVSGDEDENYRERDESSTILQRLNNEGRNPLARKQLLALENMLELISIQVRPTSTMKRMLLELRHRGLEPILLKDSNPYTGTLNVIRTESSLPGTRYFHAQYLSDKKSKAFLQHVSFEFRPGKKAKQQVVEMMKEKFPSLGQPESQTSNYTAWRVNGDYLFWVKELSQEDLVSDEFNAYTNDDVGTIRVAMEWDVHADNHHASHNH